MGEAVASSEEGVEMGVEEAGGNEKKEKGNPSPGVVRWERFLPQMVLRVLLVEADDSTRQIIAALLRKSSYRVAAVPDGLKAWEILKGRPHNIDLILTEVELPSISGYALLTLIMEHEICKNIPVIMMSSQDSVSVVFKCMLRGAADFLIKPVRKNELRNLWQHVWRRQIQAMGHVTEKTAVEQQRAEVTSENNAVSSYSSDCLDYTHEDKECTEKGSDVQSSCTTPYLEAESAYMQNMQGLLHLKRGIVSNLSNAEKNEEFMKLEKSFSPKHEIGGKSTGIAPATSLYNEAFKSTAFTLGCDRVYDDRVARDADSKSKIQGQHTDDNVKSFSLAGDLGESSNGVLDLIGKFESPPKVTCTYLNSDNYTNKFSSTLELELSLRRLRPSQAEPVLTDERHILNHSNASAFSWYKNGKASELISPTLTTNVSELKDEAVTSQNELFNHPPWSRVCTESRETASHSQQNAPALFTGQCGSSKIAVPRPQLGFSPAWSPKFQQELSPFLVSSTLCPSSEIHTSEQDENQYEETTNHSAGPTVPEEDKKLKSMEVVRHGSPTPELSCIGGLSISIANKLNNGACQTTCNGSDSGATPAPTTVGPSASESVNDNHFFICEGLEGTDSHYSSQREAALIKFRLKRKDRCFEKRVRYQSRKRLAEQRPRVKGQFVRQVQTGPPQPESWSADG
ncbi:hypothetical protein NMG60_11028851 [Bertholletia excelsa]